MLLGGGAAFAAGLRIGSVWLSVGRGQGGPSYRFDFRGAVRFPKPGSCCLMGPSEGQSEFQLFSLHRAARPRCPRQAALAFARSLVEGLAQARRRGGGRARRAAAKASTSNSCFFKCVSRYGSLCLCSLTSRHVLLFLCLLHICVAFEQRHLEQAGGKEDRIRASDLSRAGVFRGACSLGPPSLFSLCYINILPNKAKQRHATYNEGGPLNRGHLKIPTWTSETEPSGGADDRETARRITYIYIYIYMYILFYPILSYPILFSPSLSLSIYIYIMPLIY